MSSPSPPAATATAATSGKVVLLVDDQKLIRLGATAMLEDAGYEVIEAESAAQALSLLESGKPLDVLVTDYAMPGMSGAALARAARILRPDLPVLLITGYSVEDDAEVAHLPRLTKPFDKAELTAAIAKILRA